MWNPARSISRLTCSKTGLILCQDNIKTDWENMKTYLLISACLLLTGCSAATSAQTLKETSKVTPPNTTAQDKFMATTWSASETAAILDKTMNIHFAYDPSVLTANERKAAAELLQAGERLHMLYIEQKHPQARAAKTALMASDRTDLQDVFRIMKGPIATTLDNQRAAIMAVSTEAPAKNIYPQGLDKDAFDAFFKANPARRDDLLHLRSVVKRANQNNRTLALKTLDRRPTLDVLHPGLRTYIETAEDYFALPYSVAYADDVFYIYERLNAAADHIANEDIAFARYLRLRARDILADNYDGGDATWVTASFSGNLNAQIGSYETYDDALYGVKSFFSLSLLQRDIEQSDRLASAIGDIQAIENALPYSAQKQVRSNIPVGVYNVMADFGQARGTNTATILPNEGHLSRQFGRTILIRSNVLQSPQIFSEALKGFTAATNPTHQNDLEIEGNFYRTLWHEVGHYLGPDQTKNGQDIDAALQDTADMMEEMKADLVSLFTAPRLYDAGNYTDDKLRAIYASGILRSLQKNKPRRSQAYGTMQLIQWNWFMDKGLIRFENDALSIDYERYSGAVESLLKAVLDLQYQGDREAANQFVDKWTAWDEKLHGVIADKMKGAEGSRYRLVTYGALGETAR